MKPQNTENQKPAYFIGLLSGTSVDAIDAALVKFQDNQIALIAHHQHPWDADVKKRLLTASQNETLALDKLGALDHITGHYFADAVCTLLKKTDLNAADITAIGSHGQTIRHRPNLQHPYTLQIGDANIIAARTGITTIADFRRRDIACGGQGAPLTPAFHQAYLHSTQETRIVVNIGGIANLTVLSKDSQTLIGFDSGPGNGLLDAWILQHQNKNYDHEGTWSASGTVQTDLLAHFLADPYFKQAPPKSTGRDYFNLNWIDQQLASKKQLCRPEDIQATLLALTTQSIAQAITHYAPESGRVILCGGGIHNQQLVKQLREALGNYQLSSSAEFGIEPDWLEAMAFAWLAKQNLAGKAIDLTTVTGAHEKTLLGSIYPKTII